MLYIDDQHIYIINIWIGLMQDYAKNEKIGKKPIFGYSAAHHNTVISDQF
jgi:hypothetical protein